MYASKVLKSLLDHAKNPTLVDPFPLSAQYARAFRTDDEDNDEATCQEELGSVKRKVGFNGGIKKNAGKKQQGATVRLRTFRGFQVGRVMRGSGSDSMQEAPVYSPHLYMEKFKIYIMAAAKEGISAKSARESWKTSLERALLLKDVSVPELKRRRFVAKGCKTNPFQAIAAAARA